MKRAGLVFFVSAGIVAALPMVIQPDPLGIVIAEVAAAGIALRGYLEVRKATRSARPASGLQPAGPSVLDEIEEFGRPAILRAYVADKAHKRSRRMWRFIVFLSAIIGLFLAGYMLWDGLEDRSQLGWLALPVIGIAIFVEVNHRRESNVLPVALAGHGLSNERKLALILELDTSPRFAGLRAETAQAALDVFIERSAVAGGGLNVITSFDDEPKSPSAMS